MKLFLSLLVVANLLLFGWLRGWMAPLGGDGREPGRVERQVRPDELRIVPADRADAKAAGPVAGPTGPTGPTSRAGGGAGPGTGATAAGTSPAPSPTAAVGSGAGAAVPAASAAPGAAATGPAPAVAPGPAASAAIPGTAAATNGGAGAGGPATSAPASGTVPGAAPPGAIAPAAPSAGTLAAALRATGCAEVGPMSEADAVRVQVALDAIVADLTISTRRADEITSWWVYLPPSSADLGRRLADLRERGVTDVYVMPDGPWKGAISLGLFRQEELAVALQQRIAARGVRGVRVAPRGPPPGRVTLRVRPVGDALIAELARLRAALPEAVARPCTARG